jgi:hypothetical protein
MSVKYQVDGDIFREITTNWLCASISEFLIKIRKTELDQDGAVIEFLQLTDGRVFSRPVPVLQAVNVSRARNTRMRNTRLAIHDAITQSR